MSLLDELREDLKGESEETMAKRTVSGVEVTADRIVVKLIDLLLEQQRAIDKMRKELGEHFEMIAEQQPKLREDGKLVARVMRLQGETAVEMDVVIPWSQASEGDN